MSDARLPDSGLRALLSLDARRQRYLDVEAALAAAQAEVGLVPKDAAAAIVAGARLELLDEQRLATEHARTGHLMVPIIGELSRVVGDEHGGWVHWGATTQNIQQTGDVLGIRDAHRIITNLLVDVLADLAELADRYADTVMAGRTHAQQAVPVTFGYKVAAWADAMLRHLATPRRTPRTTVHRHGGRCNGHVCRDGSLRTGSPRRARPPARARQHAGALTQHR